MVETIVHQHILIIEKIYFSSSWRIDTTITVQAEHSNNFTRSKKKKNITDIHKYLMKKHNINDKMFRLFKQVFIVILSFFNH